MNGEKSELIRIGETIYRLRKSRKMSQKELAEKADISHEYPDFCKDSESAFCHGRRDF